MNYNVLCVNQIQRGSKRWVASECSDTASRRCATSRVLLPLILAPWLPIFLTYPSEKRSGCG